MIGPHSGEFDKAYMNAVFDYGYQRAKRGYPWQKVPPGPRRLAANGGQESACGWCKDKWGVSWQITPRMLTEAMAAGGAEAKRAFKR